MAPTAETGEKLDGQIAMVTGGGRGIGRAIAVTLASAGMRVAVVARSSRETNYTVELIRQSGGHAHAYTVDIADAQRVQATLAQVELALGGVHLLVNNAAQIGPIGPFHETDLERWWAAMDVNLRGALQCTRALLPGMIARGFGRIINIVTSAAPFAYLSSYVTSKTALTRFTEIIAAELQPHGIKAFAVMPGTVRTAMSEYSLNSSEGREWLPWFQRLFAEGLDVCPEVPAHFVLELARGRADALSGRVLTARDDLSALTASTPEIQANKLYTLRVRTLNSDVDSTLEAIRAAGERARHVSLRIERDFAASPERVFRLWIEPAAVKNWFTYAADVHWDRDPSIEATTGGGYDWQVSADADAARIFHFQGSYLDVRPAARLSFSWNWRMLPIEGAEGPGRTLVNVEFNGNRDTTKVVLIQSGLPSEAASSAHMKGWNRCFDGMAELISREKNLPTAIEGPTSMMRTVVD